MDTWRNSSFLTSQSMGTKDICILVVHDDPMQRNIILEMLENCSHYEVMKFKRADDALKIIQEKKEWLNIVLTDVHRLHSNGFEILNYIEKEFKLPVISMTPHQNARVVPVGLGSDAKLYFVKSLGVNEFKILWQNAYTKERGKRSSFQSLSVVKEKETGTCLGSKSPLREMIREDQNGKKIKFEETDEQSEEDKDDSLREKKHRVVWNEPMHQKFLKAVQELGLDRAYPKKILEIMNIPGLTRDNVASHLQKYRKCLKRAHEEMQSTSSIFGINSTSLSHSDSISSKTNQAQFFTQKKLFTSYQHRSSPVTISNFLYPETSTSTSNLGQQQFPCAHNSFLDSKTQSSTCPININMNMPLSNLYSYHLDTSTSPTNLEQQSFFNQESFISPFTYNSPLIATTQTHSSPLANENTPPDFSKNTSYAGLGITGNGKLTESGQTSAQNSNAYTMKANLLNDRNGNESLAPFPSTLMDDNYEQQFYVPPAECEIGDLLDELGGITSPDIILDFDDSLLDHI